MPCEGRKSSGTVLWKAGRQRCSRVDRGCGRPEGAALKTQMDDFVNRSTCGSQIPQNTRGLPHTAGIRKPRHTGIGHSAKPSFVRECPYNTSEIPLQTKNTPKNTGASFIPCRAYHFLTRPSSSCIALSSLAQNTPRIPGAVFTGFLQDRRGGFSGAEGSRCLVRGDPNITQHLHADPRGSDPQPPAAPSRHSDQATARQAAYRAAESGAGLRACLKCATGDRARRPDPPPLMAAGKKGSRC